jgi:hydrogenase maturation protein HypF
MAENELAPPVSGVPWDGTGLGTDGTLWGGEFLGITQSSVERTGHLRTFQLPGGETAIREPRRAALGLLYEIFSDNVFEMDHFAPIRSFSKEDRRVLCAQLEKGLNAPVTSSAGRLFDAVASIIGIHQIAGYEGRAAMELEFAAARVTTDESYPFNVTNIDGRFVIDWEPMVRAIIAETTDSTNIEEIAAKFHNTLAEIIVDATRRMNEERVVLTGGCFQNKYLTERAIARLENSGFRPHWHQRVPPNDGGIALGQVLAAAYLDSGDAG